MPLCAAGPLCGWLHNRGGKRDSMQLQREGEASSRQQNGRAEILWTSCDTIFIRSTDCIACESYSHHIRSPFGVQSMLHATMKKLSYLHNHQYNILFIFNDNMFFGCEPIMLIRINNIHIFFVELWSQELLDPALPCSLTGPCKTPLNCQIS